MAHRRHEPVQEEESVEGAPLWIISFADMMSLLMAFFVMLSTFSSFGPAETAKLHKAVKATLMADYYGGWFHSQPRGAIGPQSLAAGQLAKGSEKPTLDESPGNALLAESQPEDFRTRKIFVVESKDVFWAAGITLSARGREYLDTLAAYAGNLPDRLIVSESGSGDDPELGLRRAIVIVKYLADRGISKDRCSIGMAGMRPRDEAGAERTLEIVLLDESAYQ
jgi:outer membrane protein OmpA-like peptidoglycan-associated protein